VISDARARPREEDDAVPSPEVMPTSDLDTATDTEPAADEAPVAAGGRRRLRRDRAAAGSGAGRRTSGGEDGGDGGGRGAAARDKPALPLVPVLAVLLVLLLAGAGFLWFTRPGESAVRTDDYVDALQAARSGVVDMTSFDYLTLDDDIQQIRGVTVGDLRKEAVDQLDSRRQEITDSQATVNTEVVGAGVTRADSDAATVLLVIQSTQKSTASEQAQVVRYRIRVELQKSGGRWLLSGIAGTGVTGG
jgi:Mce-associated membrane protein